MVSEINGLEALDTQFGVAQPLTVPEALQAACFGDAPPTAAETALRREDQTLRFFALLDASAIPNLPELLVQSDLPHRCLFQNADSDMEMLAPWLVELREGDRFTRHLFTHDKDRPAAWHLWNHQAGFFIRARLELDGLVRHLKKFTKLTDRRGKWHLVRYWETRVFWAALDRNEPLLIELLTGLSSAIVLRDDRARIATAPLAADPKPKTLTDETRQRLMLIWNAQKIGEFLQGALPYQIRCAYGAGSAEAEDFSARVLDWCLRFDIHSLRDIQRFAIIHAFLGLGFDRDLALPEDLRGQAIREHLSAEGNSTESFAKYIRTYHADRLDLGARCRRTASQLQPGTRYHDIYTGLLRADGPDAATNSLVTQLNRDILGVNFASNPLVRNCLLTPPSTGTVSETYDALTAQIETQAERFDDRN